MEMITSKPELPEPVSPNLYTREYFTTDCEGYHLLEEGPDKLPDRIREALDMAGNVSGKWVLDIGCGRGELVCEAARRGAHAVGIDYADAAIELSLERRARLEDDVRERAHFLLADAKGLDFADGSFDVVFLIDVYEHLHPYEIERTLAEVRRVLRPGGRFIVHTGPNTWFYRFGYPLVRTAARLLLNRELPESLRGQYDDVMHVNEQNPLTLGRGMRAAGFRTRVIPRSFFVGIRPSAWEKAVMKVLFARPLGYFFCTSLMAEGCPRLGGREAELRVGRAADMLRPPRGGRVLLVGEREGKLANLLAGLAETEVFWARPLPVQLPLESFPKEVRGGVTRLTVEPSRLPFPSGYFHALAAQFTLEQVEDVDSVLEEWKRVLATGGTLVVVSRNGTYRGWEPRPAPRARRAFTLVTMRELLERKGFRVEEKTTLFPNLVLPALYRGDQGFFQYLESIPCLRGRGRIMLVRAVKEGG